MFSAEYHVPWEVLKNLGPVIDDGSYSPQQYLEFRWTPKQAHVLTFKDEVISIRELDVSHRKGKKICPLIEFFRI